VAPALHEALAAMREAAISGEESALKLAILGAVIVKRAPEIELDYLQIVDPHSLNPVDVVRPGSRAIVAVLIDDVRLIDNMELMSETPQA
jgi:pantothenate synthetase